jgi:serine/threonine-protein kinase
MSSERGEPVADDDVAGTPFGSPGGDARAAERPGRVNVLTPGGWANVSFGDRRLGPTPGQFTLPAGRHAIRVEPGTGEEPRTVWVTVRPGRVSRLVLPLD